MPQMVNFLGLERFFIGIGLGKLIGFKIQEYNWHEMNRSGTLTISSQCLQNQIFKRTVIHAFATYTFYIARLSKRII